MDRDTLVQQVQLNILERYDVLLDCSEIDDSTLTRLSKRLPKPNGEHATFARWCEHVLGEFRPAVARFDDSVPGQLHIEKLRLGLSNRLSRREKALTAQVKQLQKQIDTLQAERSTARTDVTPAHDIERARWIYAWQQFYASPRDILLHLLDDAQDIEGSIREYQGEPNRTFRQRIVEAIQGMLSHLEYLGFGIDVTLLTYEEQGCKAQSIEFFCSQEPQNGFTPCVSFDVSKMSTDILTSPPDAISDKSTCKFILYRRDDDGATLEEIEHLGAFLHMLFATLAKSADHVPRGGLRENLLLSLMLSWSAPNIDLRGMANSSALPRFNSADEEPRRTELSPGQIFNLLANTLASHIGR